MSDSDNPISRMGEKRRPGNPAWVKGKSANPGGKPSIERDLEAAGALDPSSPKSPAEARAKWWAMILPVAFGGPQAVNDPNWRYAAQEVGQRLLGKPKEHVEVTGISPDAEALLAALRLTPHERRLAAQDSTSESEDSTEDDAAMAELTGDAPSDH